MDRFCEMSDEDKRALIKKHDKSQEHVDKMNAYCELDEDARAEYIAEHKDDYKSQMKEKMSDYKKDHMMSADTMKDTRKDITNHKAEYERFCQMTPEVLETSIDNPERLAKVT